MIAREHDLSITRQAEGIAPCSVELRGASAAVMTLSGLGLLGNGVLVGFLFVVRSKSGS